MEPLDAAMLTAELLGDPMRVGHLRLLSLRGETPGDAVPDIDRLVPYTEEALVELETALGLP